MRGVVAKKLRRQAFVFCNPKAGMFQGADGSLRWEPKSYRGVYKMLKASHKLQEWGHR